VNRHPSLDPSIAHASFAAMGTDAEVIVVARNAPGRSARGLCARAQRRVAELEERWSRFLPTSETTALTDHAGEALLVSADTQLLVRRAIDAWRRSGGLFDPTILGAVVRAGYDRPFDQVRTAPRRGHSDLVLACSDIVVDGDRVRLPAGAGFDPGAIGKGLAADLVVEELLAAGAEGACVNLGGDLRVEGTSPVGDGWTVAVEHPGLVAPTVLLGLRAGAVATSTTLRRRWTVDGGPRHHVIDPRTGEPSDTDVVLATAIAGQAWIAEAMATTCLLRGGARAFDLHDGTFEALIVTDDGAIHATPGVGAFLGDVPLPARLDRSDGLVVQEAGR
jgi:thiamine biosynthesis lipoprotein